MPLLEIHDLTMTFGGLKALDRVSLSVEEGEIVSLIGPNGAGKTTVFNIVSGNYNPSAGRIMFRGRPLHGQAMWKIARQGIGRTFQNIRLFNSLTALENVRISLTARLRYSVLGSVLLLPSSRAAEERFNSRALEVLSVVGLDHRAETVASSLTYGQQRRLEMARALALEPSLLLLDEPSAGMPTHETLELMETVKGFRDQGITIFLVEHDMKMVMGISDRVIVLDNGAKIAEGTPDEVRNNPEVIRAYLGEEDL